MLINAKKYTNVYKCKKIVADYLIYEKNIPVFDVDKDYYYFRDNEFFKEILGSLPLWIQIIDKLTPR